MSGMHTIGLRLIAHNHASHALAALAGELMHVHQIVTKTNLAMANFRTALVGMGSMYIGGKILGGVKHLVDDGAHFVTLQNQMIAQGWKHKDLAEATANAYSVSAKYQSISAEETLKMTKELAPVLGDRHHAVELTEQMAKFYVGMLGTLGKDGAGSFTKEIQNAVRAGELSGNVLDPKRFETYIDGMAKTLKAFGGTLTPSDYFQATKMGRAGAINWSDEFTNLYLPTLMQELGASSAGTGLMTLYQAVVGGRMRLRSISKFDELGLIDRSKLNPETDLTAEGHVKKLQPGAFVGSRMLMEDPNKWVHEYMIPAFLKNGIISQAGLDQVYAGNIKEGLGKETRKAITEVVAVMFGDRTAQGVVDFFALQKRKFDRDARLIQEAYGLDEGVKLYGEKDYGVAGVALTEQLHNLRQALGAPGVHTATVALHGLTAAISGLAGVFQRNPALGAMTLGAITTVGATMFIGGLMTLASLLVPGGALVVGLAALVGAVGALAAMNWDKIKSWYYGEKEHYDKRGGHHARQEGFKDRLNAMFSSETWKGIGANFMKTGGELMGRIKTNISTTYDAIMKSMQEVGSKMAAAISSIPGMVYGAIQGMASAIGNAISGAISGAAGAAKGWWGRNAPSFLGGNSGGGGVQKQNFVPPSSGGSNIIKAELHVDGRKMAESVTRHQVRSARNVGSAATFDSIAHPTPVDYAHA